MDRWMDRQVVKWIQKKGRWVDRGKRERESMSSLVPLFTIVTGDWSADRAVPHTQLADTRPLHHHMSALCVPSTPQQSIAAYGQHSPPCGGRGHDSPKSKATVTQQRNNKL